jgi:hypothetical protein
VDPTGTIADYAAVGAVLGAAVALLRQRKEMLNEWIAWGLVAGAIVGILKLVVLALT